MLFRSIAEALDPQGIEVVRERLAAQADAEQRLGHHQLALTQDVGGINQWVYMLLNKGEVFQRLLFQPVVSAVVKQWQKPCGSHSPKMVTI